MIRVLVWIAAASALIAQTPDCSLVAGWQQKGPSRTYTADNLYDYMNGNSEGYLIYQFVRMNGVSCASGDTTIVFDISEMANPDSAFGIFVSNRDPRQKTEKIGMAGQVLPQRAIFAKDKYFVELAANPAGDHSLVLRRFVVAMEKRIEGRTTLPDALAWFPPEGLDADAIRLVPESVLGLRMLKRGFVAPYASGKAFLIPEATPTSATSVFERLKARIGETKPVQIADEAFEATDRYLGKLCVFRKGRYLAGFANLKPEDDAAARAKILAARIP
jgi:hypothetical protein